MRAILVLTAIELEARALARALDLPRLPSSSPVAHGRDAVRVAAVGVGALRLDARWPALVAGLDGPLVVSAGVCGGLDPALAPADLVLPARVLGPGGERLDVTVPAHREALAAAPAAVTGPLAVARHVVATPEAKAALFARTGAVAVDMESAAIVGRAAAAGLPALVVRAVSDPAARAVPARLLRLLTPDGRVRLAGALGLAARPPLWPAALALRRTTARALAAVGAVLAALAAAPEGRPAERVR